MEKGAVSPGSDRTAVPFLNGTEGTFQTPPGHHYVPWALSDSSWWHFKHSTHAMIFLMLLFPEITAGISCSPCLLLVLSLVYDLATFKPCDLYRLILHRFLWPPTSALWRQSSLLGWLFARWVAFRGPLWGVEEPRVTQRHAHTLMYPPRGT